MAYIGLGIPYIEELDTGAAFEAENAVKVEIKGNTKNIPIPSRRNDGSAGSLLYQVFRKEQEDISIEFDAYPPRLLATQLMGTIEKVVEAAASIADEVYYPTRSMGILIPHGNISNVAIVPSVVTAFGGFTVNGALSKGDTAIVVDGTTTGALSVGAIFKIGSSEYKYRIESLNMTGTNPNITGTITIAEGLQEDVADGAALTQVTAFATTTDFTIGNAKSGFVQFTDKMPGSDMANSLGSIKVSYDYGGREFERIKGGIKPSIPIKVVLDATNDATNEEGLLTVRRARVTPDQAFDWMSDAPQTIKLNGKLELVTGYTETYTFDTGIVNT